MTAFFISEVKIKNPTLFQQYAESAGKTFAAYGGSPVMKGKYERPLVGGLDGHSAVDTVGIVSFPSQEKLENWFNSEEYQALVPLRDEAAKMNIVMYNVPS
jgi:uncharacterized protein (DUF1330 family)